MTEGNSGPVRIGLLRLTDAAPVIVAAEKGFFAEEGVEVRLSVEPSWANIADKLTFGQLDAAVMLPPLAFAVTLRLRGVGTDLIVPMSLSLNGNSVTVTNALADRLGSAGGTARDVGRSLAALVGPGKERLRFAVVHVFSTHHLLLRYWLAASGIDPDRDVDISVIPPADMVDALQAGEIDGFCAGAPWGEVAARRGLGRTIVLTSEIWRNHPEKCLAIKRDWAEANPARADRLVVALLRAARFCDAPENADEIAAILAREDYLAVDPAFIRASLPAGDATNEARGDVDRSVFFANAANFPWRSHAAWFLAQMARWGHLAPVTDRARLIESVYRPDLFRTAALELGLPVPPIDGEPKGIHTGPSF